MAYYTGASSSSVQASNTSTKKNSAGGASENQAAKAAVDSLKSYNAATTPTDRVNQINTQLKAANSANGNTSNTSTSSNKTASNAYNIPNGGTPQSAYAREDAQAAQRALEQKEYNTVANRQEAKQAERDNSAKLETAPAPTTPSTYYDDRGYPSSYDKATAAQPTTQEQPVKYDSDYYNGQYVGGSGAGANDGGTTTQQGADAETEKAEPTISQEEQLRQAWADAGAVTQKLIDGARPEDISIDEIDRIDVSDLEAKLEQIRQIQEQRATGQVDYAVEQGVNEINRAVEDAAPQYQTQRNQIAADEQRALDNQALYAQARGDRGGIGQAQYASIQNTAATNRYKVNQEQTKLSTDAARQIADLRAKGEFEKADDILEITQSYLQQLNALEQWQKEANVSVDEFNTSLAQWKADYDMAVKQYLINAEMSAASMTGAFADGTPTLTARNLVQEQLASAAAAMLNMGLDLTDSQIAALGWTKDQYAAYKNQRAAEAAAGYDDYYYNPISSTTVGNDYIRAFQREAGIEADGLIGNQTRDALNRAGFNTMEDAYNYSVQTGAWE